MRSLRLISRMCYDAPAIAVELVLRVPHLVLTKSQKGMSHVYRQRRIET